jgi:hypothetical protein
MKKYITALILLLTIASCELYEQDEYIEQVVVESYQVANQPLSPVYLSRTAPIFERYDKAERGINDAQVQVRVLSPKGDLVDIISFQRTGPGTYNAVDADITVKPRYRYELNATIPSMDTRLQTATVVPDTFSIKRINATELVYQGAQQFELTLSPSFFPGRQSYYVFTNETLDPEGAEFTPFYADASGNREDFYRVSSGIINQNSTDQNEDIVKLTFPWIGVAFYGPNRLKATAIDDNMYDYIRSLQIQGGGSTLSPGEIENVISNVVGGIGLFGSYAEVSVDVRVLKP